MNLTPFRKPVVVVSEDETVTDSAKKMRAARIGCVIVVRNSHPVGILTDRDIALRVVAEGLDPNTTRVREVATADPFVLAEDASLSTAITRMQTHGVRRLPLVGPGGDVTGIVTADDLLVVLGRELKSLSDCVEEGSDSTDSR